MRGMTANGDLIRELRKGRGLTQERLAELAGLDVKTVRNAEQRKRLDLGSITKLCFVLQAELRQLIIRPSRSTHELEIRRRDAVISWQRAFNDGDLDRLVGCYHQDAELHLPGAPLIAFGGAHRGKRRIRRATQMAWNYCHPEPLDEQGYVILASTDVIIVQGHKRVRSPEGGPSKLHYTQTFKFRGEQIVEHRVEYDTLNFARLVRIPLAGASADTSTVKAPRNHKTSR